jgi:hypothetical protein
MKLIVKFFCFLLVLGLAGLFVLKKPDGSPWLSADELIPNAQSLITDSMSLVNKAKKLTEKEIVNDNNNGAIYRWQDANGQWQYSDTAPSNQTVESINISGNLNSDLAEKMTPPPEQIISSSPQEEASSPLPTTISPEKISTLMEDAKNIQKIMNDRTSKINTQLQ